MGMLSTVAAIVALAAVFGAGNVQGAEPASIEEAELNAHLASAQQAMASGDRDGAVRAFDAIAAFYRRGGDQASAAAADLEAARLLFAQERFDDAFALLERSEGHEIASARLAQRQHIRAFVLERKGDVAGARRSIAAVSRRVTREDWNRHLADDAKRLGVGFGWPALERRWLTPILLLEWGALIALVLVVYRRAVRRDAVAAKPGE
jgi:tetratricopeptide (TPR) repeat protein